MNPPPLCAAVRICYDIREVRHMRINEIIREKRRALGLTQEEAASRLGVTASAVNKWERGASLPDITLLPALARLLGVDLNTLLDFSEDMSDEQIGEFVNSLDAEVKKEGYAAAFERAEAKIREYPGCEKLLLSAAYYLDGAQYLYGAEDTGQYRQKLDGWYERLAGSADPDVRAQALVMVINRCRSNGELGRAEALIDSLPRNTVDRSEQLALLYTAQGRLDEARPLWQSRVLEGISEAVTAMNHLVEDALKCGRREDAERIARAIVDVNAAARLPEWMGLSALIGLAEAAGDEDGHASLVERLKASLETPWEPGGSPLYSTFSAGGVNLLTERISEMLIHEAEND